jgi:methionyl-tRNA synthetase
MTSYCFFSQYVTGFKSLNQRILISNDDYVRTTSDRHKRAAKELWKRCADNGDVYLDTYSGWYNVREETFVTESEAALAEYKDPTSGVPLKQVDEESYFFKMSAYHDRLITHIKKMLTSSDLRSIATSFLPVLRQMALEIYPSHAQLSHGYQHARRIQGQPCHVCVARRSLNYLTGVNGLGVNDDGSMAELSNFWPASVHIIGKDILWFHTVIWPCLLMSAGVALPKTVFAHGFVNDKEGKKMSKSLGNVVDPHDMLDKYSVDTFRWYLCKEAPYGGELSFSEDSLRAMHNADLCDTLGNLVHRATNLCGKYCDGVVPDVPAPLNPPINLANIIEQYSNMMENFELEGGATLSNT